MMTTRLKLFCSVLALLVQLGASYSPLLRSPLAAPSSPLPRCVRRRTSSTVHLQQEESEVDVLPAEADAAAEEESEFVRPPPAYPEGLHDPAKADRTGPFWSSLGEPDVSTGVRPAYLRRDDWHISSTYTAEQRAAVTAEEEEWTESVRVETPEDGAVIDTTAEDEAYDPFVELEHMKLEAELANGAEPSELKMPNSWQDYQLLQEKCAALTVVEALSAADRAEAAKHEQNLANFYGTFKDILAGGWAMLNNVEVEDAVRFIELKEGKKSVGAGTGSGDDEEFARTVQE